MSNNHTVNGMFPIGPNEAQPSVGAFSLRSRFSLDIFFQSDAKGAARLVPSSHMGHEWFLRVAESCRGLFLGALAQEDRSIECSEIATALASKLMEKGTIFEQRKNSPWHAVRDIYAARDLVFRGLLTLFTGKQEQPAQPLAPPPAPVAAPLNVAVAVSSKKRRPSEGPPKKRLKQAPLQPPIVGIGPPPCVFQLPSPAFQALPSTPAAVATPVAAFGVKDVRRHHSQKPPATASIVTRLSKHDVICGLRQDEGVLLNDEYGNTLFRCIASSVAGTFAVASTHEKARYTMQAIDLMQNLSPPGRFVVKDKSSSSFRELTLEEARWRAYWAFEKEVAFAQSGGQHVAAVTAMQRELLRRVMNEQEEEQEEEEEVVNDTAPSKDDRPLTEEEQKEMFKYVPTHLSLVAKQENEERHHHMVEIIGGLVIQSPDSASDKSAEEQSTEEASKPAAKSNVLEKIRQERNARRQEKLERAKAILAGREVPSVATNGNPFDDVEERREQAILLLKERQKRTKIRRRLATWDPSSLQDYE